MITIRRGCGGVSPISETSRYCTPDHDNDDGHDDEQVEMKPDLAATTFSAQNAYFFANLSKIAYKPEQEARGLVKGNSTCEGLGFDRFHWFEVRCDVM